MVVIIGLVISLIFSGNSINLHYPQILMTDDSFTVISTSHYLLRGFVLFICAGIVAFGLIFLISTWLKNSFSALIITGFIIINRILYGRFIYTIANCFQSILLFSFHTSTGRAT